MNFDPNDLIELMKAVEDSKQLLIVVGELLNTLVPEIMETLAPSVGHLFKGVAGAEWHFYEAYKEAGFTEQQAFTLLLNYHTRMEELGKNTGSSATRIKIKSDSPEELPL